MIEFEFINIYMIFTFLNKSLPFLTAIPDEKICNLKYYQHLTESLNHLAIFTHPDIIFTTSKLAQFNSNPTARHLTVIFRVLCYLKGTRNLSVIYKRQEQLTILDHSNSD